jgi:hypothetical protein
MEDVLIVNAREKILPTFFLPLDRAGNGALHARALYAKTLPGRTREAGEQILAVIREHVPPTIDYSLVTLDEAIDEIALVENLLFRLIALFAAIAIVISLTGVYSSVLLDTGRRRKEVAIRKINGASLANIFTLFSRFYLLAFVVAAIPALALARVATTRWLESYAYRVAVPGWIYLAVVTSVAALLLLVITRRVVDTARLNPADIIKTE